MRQNKTTLRRQTQSLKVKSTMTIVVIKKLILRAYETQVNNMLEHQLRIKKNLKIL